MHLRGRSCVVTGAASGIGRALAHHAHQRGAHVVAVDRDAAALERAAREFDGHAVAMDVSSVEDNERLAASVDVPTLLCLNAGVTSTSPGAVWEAPPDEWQRVLGINLGGVVNGLRAFVPRMLASGEEHHILITASLAGLATWPGGGPYAASKHAVVAVAEQASLALVEHPIHVTVLCPALVRTGMSEEGDDPVEVARHGLEALDQGRFAVVPSAWRRAVEARGERLASGDLPLMPQASATSGS